MRFAPGNLNTPFKLAEQPLPQQAVADEHKMRAVVLISGSGSNLQAFIDQIESGRLALEIVLVISNKAGAYGIQRANNAGIKNRVIEHTNFDSRLGFDQELISTIDAVDAELVILAGFMRILTAEFVRHYQGRLINIHPSLLPNYPGTNTHQRALEAGDKWHGASVHFVVPEVDAGPVIAQGRLAVLRTDTPETLQQRIHVIEHQIYPQVADWFAAGRLKVVDNQVLLDDETSSLQLQTFDV